MSVGHCQKMPYNDRISPSGYHPVGNRHDRCKREKREGRTFLEEREKGRNKIESMVLSQWY